MLSVFSPVNVSYQNIGYIVIHKTMSHITAGVNGFMNISFYTVALIFAFAFVLLFMMSRSIYRPISKITKTAKKYARVISLPRLMYIPMTKSAIWQTH